MIHHGHGVKKSIVLVRDTEPGKAGVGLTAVRITALDAQYIQYDDEAENEKRSPVIGMDGKAGMVAVIAFQKWQIINDICCEGRILIPKIAGDFFLIIKRFGRVVVLDKFRDHLVIV